MLDGPEFVDQTTPDGDRTVGIASDLYAAYDETGQALDAAIDRRHLDETQAVIAALRSVSREHGICLGLELNQDSVGWIDGGGLSDDLQHGLIDPWVARFTSQPAVSPRDPGKNGAHDARL